MKVVVIFVVFLSLLIIYFLSHIYVTNVISKAGFIKNNILLKKVFLVLCCFSILSLFFRIKFSCKICEYVYILSFLWMGAILILLLWCVVGDIILLVFNNIKKDYVVICILILSFISIAKSVYDGFKIPKLKEIKIELTNVRKNYTIVFVSDIHIDFSYKTKIVTKIFEKIKQTTPDLLIVGGDFFDPGFKLDNKLVEMFNNIDTEKIAVFGNHEYYFGVEKTYDVLNQFRFRILKNESFEFEDFNIIGIGDIRTENMSKNDVINFVSKNYKENKVNIFVSHQPLYFKEISDKFDVIMLSGHNHKGQIFPFHILTKMTYKYFYGLYKNKNSVLYVTSGVGVWGPPMRFFAEPEIVEINVRKK